MEILPEAFQKQLKRKNLSQAKLAEIVGASANTFSNWSKEGHEARRSLVERVARALECTIHDLTEVSKSDEEKENSQYISPYVEMDLIAHYYKVSPLVIMELAPVMFTIIAEQALNDRKDEVTNWYECIKEKAVNHPAGLKSPIYEKSFKERLEYSDFADAYYEELEKLENRDFSIDDEENHDLFFRKLYELDTRDAAASTRDDSHDTVKKSMGFWFYLDKAHRACNEICEQDHDNYELTCFAADRLFEADVLVSDIPAKLWRKGAGFERALWIASKGGKEDIPSELKLKVGEYEQELEKTRAENNTNGDSHAET